MTYIVKDVIDRLKASTPIAALVGDAVYAGAIPQTNKTWTQAIEVGLLSSTPETYLMGEAGRHRTILQITCLARDGFEYTVNTLAEAVRNRLSGYRGTIGSGTTYGTIHAMAENGLVLDAGEASDTKIRQRSRDYEIIHTAAIPTFT